MQQFYVRIRGKVLGPFSSSQLGIMRERGQLQDGAEISEDRKTWVAAAAIDDVLRAESAQSASPHKKTILPARPAAAFDPLEDDATIDLQAQQSVAIQGRSVVFGRNPACDQVLNFPMVSGRHARLIQTDGGLILEDLESTYGTYLNGQRIDRPVRVHPGDTILLGSFAFRPTRAGNLEKSDFRGHLTVEARNVTVQIHAKLLIEDVSFLIFPGDLVGLMGPSGAGKTTLMNVLNGYTPPTAGTVLLNGQSLYGHYAQFACHLGYVPQDDIMHRDLTVRQALYYTARLRLPADFSDFDIDARIGVILKQLGLEGTEDVLVGSPEKKGISGGQRKRVNLAMELLTDPQLLFLDEPTSGLSSEDAFQVMKLLRGLADAGKSVLITIHQPSLDVFRLMNNLVLIAKDANAPEPGRLVYYGPAYPDAVRFFDPETVSSARRGGEPSPDAVLRGLSREKTQVWLERYRLSPYHRDYVARRAGQAPAAADRIDASSRRSIFDAFQWWTLVRRLLTIKVKDTWNTAILAAQAPIIGVLMVMVYAKKLSEPVTDASGAALARSLGATMFLLALAALWFGCSNAVREIVGEWAIYRRERMVNLKLACYVASKFAVLSGLCLFQCTALLGVVSWGCGLQGSWFSMFIILYLAAMVGVALGLTVSALARTTEVAIALTPLILLPMVIFGGIMMPIHDMTGISRGVCHAMPSRWAFEGLLLLESAKRSRYTLPALPASAFAKQAPVAQDQARDVAETYFPKEKHRLGPWTSAVVLVMVLAFLVVCIHLILRARDVH